MANNPLDPNGLYDEWDVWVDKDGKEVSEASPTRYRQFHIRLYNDGSQTQQLYDPQTKSWGRESYVKTDQSQAKRFADANEVAKPPSPTSQWSIQTRNDGTKVRVNELTGQSEPIEGFGPTPVKPSTDQWQNPEDGSTWIIDQNTGEPIKRLSNPIPGWQPGLGVRWPAQAAQAPQRAPRYPDEEQLAQLNLEKARRDLQAPFALALQQQQEVMDAIQSQLAKGEISIDEANRLMALSKSNLSAALQGTTPFQMNQEKQRQKQAQQQMASSFITNRLQSGSSMASGLMSGLGGIFGNILSSAGAPYNFNPLSMAQNFTDQMTGGPQLADLAKALLTGAFQPRPQEDQLQPQGGA